MLAKVVVRARFVLLVGFLALLVLPVAAVANPLANLDVTLLVQSHGDGEPLLLVAGQLPETVALPAEIVLPVPEGATIVWSGEIVGSNAADDVQSQASIETRDGVTVAVMTLTRSRVAQIEVGFDGAIGKGADGGLTAGFEMRAPVSVQSVRNAVALPPGATPASLPEGALVAEGQQGLTYYYLEPGALETGEPIVFSMGFSQGVAPPASDSAAQPAPSGSTAEVPVLVIVLIATALAGAVLVVVASRSRRNRESADGDAYAQAEIPAEVVSDALIIGGDSGRAEEPARVDRRGFLTPQRLVLIAGVLVVGVIAAVSLGGQQGEIGVTETSDGWISQRISTASAEATADFNAFIACECPPEAEAPKMFDTLRAVTGVAHAALEETTLLLRVGYDPAQTSEEAIMQALRAAGHVR